MTAGITRPRRRHVHGISQLVLAAGSAPATASAPLRTRESPHRGAAASPRARVIHPTPSHGRAPRPDGHRGRWTSTTWGQRDKARKGANTRAPTWILSVLRDSLATSSVCAIRASKHFGEGFESGDRAAKPAPIGSCRCSTAVSASMRGLVGTPPTLPGRGLFASEALRRRTLGCASRRRRSKPLGDRSGHPRDALAKPFDLQIGSRRRVSPLRSATLSPL